MRPVNYFYNVSGEEAERLLQRYAFEGEFLARPSNSMQKHFTLSIKRGVGQNITHVQVQYSEEAFWLVGKGFSTLPELIGHFIENPEELREQDGRVIRMTKPISIPWDDNLPPHARGPIAERWFHACLTANGARDLLLKEKQWAYVVRESSRLPGNYVISVKTSEGNVKHVMIVRDNQENLFYVHGGDSFRTVNDLLAHYNHNPMVEKGSQSVVHLRGAIFSTSMPADAIDYRLAQLQLEDPVTKKDGIYLEFESIQKMDDHLYSRKEAKKPMNIAKNRYKNIVPYDHTRVILQEVREGRSDYINANYINIDEVHPHLCLRRKYISTQGCLQHTVVDMLQMAWECNSRVIVMTTKQVERGVLKCYPYWPEKGGILMFDEYSVECTEELIVYENGVDSYITRKLCITRDGEKRELMHFQFVGWPDHGCPERPEPVLDFLETIGAELDRKDAGPPIVHCSAGIGRTGTFIVIDILINHIKMCGTSCVIDIAKTLLLIREQRSGMVQTPDQYRFVYTAISAYITRTSALRSPMCSVRNSPIRARSTSSNPPPVLEQARSYVNSSPIINNAFGALSLSSN